MFVSLSLSRPPFAVQFVALTHILMHRLCVSEGE